LAIVMITSQNQNYWTSW